MEGCLIDWNQFIDKKRTEFPQLNHYTTEQLVNLCKELAVEPQEINDQAFALLHDVKPDCKVEELVKAIELRQFHFKLCSRWRWACQFHVYLSMAVCILIQIKMHILKLLFRNCLFPCHSALNTIINEI